jgi:hypothetical protein
MNSKRTLSITVLFIQLMSSDLAVAEIIPLSENRTAMSVVINFFFNVLLKYSRIASNSGLMSAFSISKVSSWLNSSMNSGNDT